MIETLQQWNTRLGYCGCCPMPVCPPPAIVCQSIEGTAKVFFATAFFPSPGPSVFHRTRIRTFAMGGTETLYASEIFDAQLGGVIVVDPEVIVTNTPPAPLNFEGFVDDFPDPIDLEVAMAAGYAAITGYARDWDLMTKSSICSSRYRLSPSQADIIVRFARHQFRIPTTHLGTKFTVTYDVAEFPTVGDPSFVSQDNVVEWTGPGTGSSSDPSWLTPFVEIDPPEVPGERRIVNIRFTCYTGTKYGVKPQVMGEALELEEPEP